MKMKKELYIYFISIFIAELSRTMPHAFATLYLIHSGFSLSQIALVPVAYMVAIIIFEVPSGVFSDKHSRKTLFCISNLILAISYLFYVMFPSFIGILLAQFLYGISTAFQTGTLDALMIEKLGKENDRDVKIELLIRNENIILSTAMVVGAVLGSFLYYNYVGKYVYIIASFGFIPSILIANKLQEPKKDVSINNFQNKFYEYKKHFIVGIQSIYSNKKLIFYISLLGITQFILQPYFNYWQPISKIKGIHDTYFSMIYLVMQFISILSSFLYKYIKKDKKNSLFIFIFISGICLITSLLFKTPSLYIILFLLSALPRSIFLIFLDFNFKRNVDDSVRSTVTSVTSMISRIFSSFTLIFTGMIATFIFDPCILLIICTIIFMILGITISFFKPKEQEA